MAKLKLGVIADDKPVKLTVELPASVHRDLVAYGQVLARETGQGAVEPGEADRADAGALHGDGPRLRQTAAGNATIRQAVVTAPRRAETRQTVRR